MNGAEYEEGGEAEAMDEGEDGEGNLAAEGDQSVQPKEGLTQGSTGVEDLDPSLAEWFKGGKPSSSSTNRVKNDSASETESDHDSDNADVADEEENMDYDDWEMVKDNKDAGESEDARDVKMGETDKAMSYDEDLIFKHL